MPLLARLASTLFLLRLASTLFLLMTGVLFAQLIQKSSNNTDPTFDSRVANPAYRPQGPKVLLDQGHFNLITAVGESVDQTFAKLIANDGYEVTRNRDRFDAKVLRGIRILVIPIAAGGNTWQTVSNPAFTPDEIECVYDWIREGGALLLIFDHHPYDAAIESLANRLGLKVSKGLAADGSGAWLSYTRENGFLQSHPLTEGRHAGERLGRIVTFGGSSFSAPDPSSEFLKLPPSAKNNAPGMHGVGRAQGTVFRLGKGRVVVLADTNMTAAQLAGGSSSRPTGMSYPEADNRQLVLNIMHWLSGLI